MGAKADASRQRRAAVLSATRDLLDAEGYSKLTMRKVADRAGVALGTIFLYADNKVDLLNQIYSERLSEKWQSFVEASAGESTFDRIEQFYLDCLDMYYADVDNIGAYYNQVYTSNTRRDRAAQDAGKMTLGILREGDAAGKLSEGASPEVVNGVYTGIYALLLVESFRGLPLEVARRHFIDMSALVRRSAQA